MKLENLINEILTPPDFQERLLENKLGIMDECIYGPNLEPYKDKILECEEFAECEELIIMKFPVTIDGDGNKIDTKTYKLTENQKFKGKCYLLSLSLTPEMFDPNKMYEPVLDGSCITPTVYDINTFEPRKKIIMEFSPEAAQDFEAINPENEIRKKLHERLDQILDNPENYRIKGTKGIMVRGMFEVVETPLEVNKTPLVKVDTEKKTHFLVFFFETDTEHSTENQINLKLSKMELPIELKEKYMEILGPKSIHVTRDEINKFLEEYEN